MKELSIEQKAEAYDKAIEGIQEILSSGQDSIKMSRLQQRLQGIFPELKESEDEQSRKWILEYLYDGLRRSDEQFKGQFKCAIAWLEKQKAIDVLDAEEREFADNVNSYHKDMEEFYKKGYDAGREAEKQYWLEKQGKKKSIDYTHTNVFTEKAAIWFNNNFIVHDEYGVISDSFDTKEEMFEDFKNYMKEE